jgi:hypothetical protein
MMHACACMGPQPGHKYCPCKEKQMMAEREIGTDGLPWPTHYFHHIPVTTQTVPQGCICPPGSEATCKGRFCPRRASQ